MTSGSSPSRENLSGFSAEWARPGWKFAFRICLLWGLGFGLLEAAYFTRTNEMFPLGFGHAVLVVFLAVEYAVVALVGPIVVRATGRIWRGLTFPLGTLAGPWLLTLILAVSHYRDRMVLHARRKEDVLITLALMAALGIALLALAAWAGRRSPRGPRRAVVALGVAIVLGAGSWLATAKSGWVELETSEAVSAEEAGSVAETGLRVLIIGMDGGEWRVLDPLIASGSLPAHADVVARGRTANVKTIEPTFSPIIWTGIATGKEVQKHRILSHVYTQPPFGLPAVPHDPRRIKNFTKVMKLNVRGGHRLGLLPLGIYSSHNLNARQIWDVVGEFGLDTVTLEWYITHPIRPVRGVQISDRFHLMKGQDEGLMQAVFPDSLVDALEPLIVAESELALDQLTQFLDVEDLDEAGRIALRKQRPEWFKTIGGEMSRDLTTRRVMREVFPRVPDWRLGSVYYRAMDGSHHMTWRYRGLPGEDVENNPDRRFRDVVDGYYRFCDELLADTMKLADENTVVFILSDHGWENQLWGHKRKPDGYFLVAGGPVVPSGERGEISILDVAPTALALLGIPVPDDIDGRVLEEMIDPAFWREHPIRRVSSYEREGVLSELADDAAANDRILEQLRTLGYIGD